MLTKYLLKWMDGGVDLALSTQVWSCDTDFGIGNVQVSVETFRR